MNTTENLRADLAQIDTDRATIKRERAMLDAWEAALDRNERHLRHAMVAITPAGEEAVTTIDGRPWRWHSKPDQRNMVLEAFRQLAARELSQKTLEVHTQLDSGALSRAVRDLEAAPWNGWRLERAGRTSTRSTIWRRVKT